MDSSEAARTLLNEYSGHYHWIEGIEVKKTEGKELLVVIVKTPYVRTGNSILPFHWEGFGVIVAPAVDKPRRVFDVKHLVIEDVLDEPFRHFP